MNVRKILSSFVCLLALYYHTPSGYAEIKAYPTWGFSIDMPEGFQPVQSKSTTHFLFHHTFMPVGVQIAVYPYQQFETVYQLTDHIAHQLQGEKRAIPFELHDTQALLSHLHFGQGNNRQVGWLLTAPLPEQQGWLALLSSTAQGYATEYEPLMISVLDSALIGHQARFESGPIMQALYPKKQVAPVSGSFFDKTIPLYFDTSDAEANQMVIDREFSLLTRYLHSPLLEAAWKRYYRIIYRDSVSRCRYIPISIEKELAQPSSAEVLPSEHDIAETVLAWVQNFSYTRKKNAADFINLPEVCIERTGDCDSRALLMAVILNQMNIDTILLISNKHKHALAAIDCKGEGARFIHKGKSYLIAETTAHLPMGKIAKEFANISDWFAVDWDYAE
ncbi:MAG: hypothetical protein ACTTH7_05385 [Treponema sp.]